MKYHLLEEKLFRREERKLSKRKRILHRLETTKTRYKGKGLTLSHLLKMPEIDFAKMEEIYGAPILKSKTLTDVSYIEAEVKYEGYIKIQQQNLERFKNLAKIHLPGDIDYNDIGGLSTEVRQKLSRSRPANLAEALVLPGITPAAINTISIYLTITRKKRKAKKTVKAPG